MCHGNSCRSRKKHARQYRRAGAARPPTRIQHSGQRKVSGVSSPSPWVPGARRPMQAWWYQSCGTAEEAGWRLRGAHAQSDAWQRPGRVHAPCPAGCAAARVLACPLSLPGSNRSRPWGCLRRTASCTGSTAWSAPAVRSGRQQAHSNRNQASSHNARLAATLHQPLHKTAPLYRSSVLPLCTALCRTCSASSWASMRTPSC